MVSANGQAYQATAPAATPSNPQASESARHSGAIRTGTPGIAARTAPGSAQSRVGIVFATAALGSLLLVAVVYKRQFGSYAAGLKGSNRHFVDEPAQSRGGSRRLRARRRGRRLDRGRPTDRTTR